MKRDIWYWIGHITRFCTTYTSNSIQLTGRLCRLVFQKHHLIFSHHLISRWNCIMIWVKPFLGDVVSNKKGFPYMDWKTRKKLAEFLLPIGIMVLWRNIAFMNVNKVVKSSHFTKSSFGSHEYFFFIGFSATKQMWSVVWDAWFLLTFFDNWFSFNDRQHRDADDLVCWCIIVSFDSFD